MKIALIATLLGAYQLFAFDIFLKVNLTFETPEIVRQHYDNETNKSESAWLLNETSIFEIASIHVFTHCYESENTKVLAFQLARNAIKLMSTCRVAQSPFFTHTAGFDELLGVLWVQGNISIGDFGHELLKHLKAAIPDSNPLGYSAECKSSGGLNFYSFNEDTSDILKAHIFEQIMNNRIVGHWSNFDKRELLPLWPKEATVILYALIPGEDKSEEKILLSEKFAAKCEEIIKNDICCNDLVQERSTLL